MTTPAAEDDSTSAGVANPGSVNCEKHGGRVEIVEGPQGQSGVCVFVDGSRCEEFRFLRGTCKPNTCRNADGICE